MSTDRLEKLQQFLSQTPNEPFLKYAIALEYLKLNQDQLALQHFEKITQEHPLYVGTYYHLGKLYEKLNLEEKALPCYEKGMEVARQLEDHHAFSELQSAWNMLNDELNY